MILLTTIFLIVLLQIKFRVSIDSTEEFIIVYYTAFFKRNGVEVRKRILIKKL